MHEDEQRDRTARESEREAQRRDVLEAHVAREVATEDGAERPERRGPERVERRLETVDRRMEGVLHAHQPRADERRDEEKGEAASRPFAENHAGADDGDDRLDLLQDDRGDEVVAVDERLREQDRRERRRAGADHDRGEDVPPARDERRRRSAAPRNGSVSRTSSDVLAEDDRRNGGRLGERCTDPRVESPERRGERDEKGRPRT